MSRAPCTARAALTRAPARAADSAEANTNANTGFAPTRGGVQMELRTGPSILGAAVHFAVTFEPPPKNPPPPSPSTPPTTTPATEPGEITI